MQELVFKSFNKKKWCRWVPTSNSQQSHNCFTVDWSTKQCVLHRYRTPTCSPWRSSVLSAGWAPCRVCPRIWRDGACVSCPAPGWSGPGAPAQTPPRATETHTRLNWIYFYFFAELKILTIKPKETIMTRCLPSLTVCFCLCGCWPRSVRPPPRQTAASSAQTAWTSPVPDQTPDKWRGEVGVRVEGVQTRGVRDTNVDTCQYRNDDKRCLRQIEERQIQTQFSWTLALLNTDECIIRGQRLYHLTQ